MKFLYCLLGIAIAIAAYEYIVWRVIPRAVSKFKPARRKQAIVVFERLLLLPSFRGLRSKRPVTRLLVNCYYLEKRYEECVNIGRNLLSWDSTRRSQATVREKVSQSLRALGRVDEANSEAMLALAAAARGTQHLNALLLQARILQSQHKFREATAIYERAIARVSNNKKRQAQIFALATPVSVAAGRPDLTVKFATEAIDLGASGLYLETTRQMAAIAYHKMGDIDLAKQHIVVARELASVSGTARWRAVIAAVEAGIVCDTGDLAGAMSGLKAAIAIDPDSAVAHGQVCRLHIITGQFTDALESATRMKKCMPGIEAITDLMLAAYYAEIGDPLQALRFHDMVAATYATDPVLSIRARSVGAWIHAQLGHADIMRALMSQVEAAIPDIVHSKALLIDNYGHLAAAALAAGMYGDCLRYHELCMAYIPYPTYLPKAYYRAAQAHAALGDTDAAAECYRQAVAVGIDTHHRRLAIQELGAEKLTV